MIAQVVPVTRLRRHTSWWSYRLPPRTDCHAGSLVVVPFRGRPTLGVVWNTEEEDANATETVLEVLSSRPLVTAPHRRLIEFLSQEGLCSLPTALHVWLPPGLRELPLSRTARQLVQDFNRSPLTVSPPKQHCILSPGKRPSLSRELRQRFKENFAELFVDTQDTSYLTRWFEIARGSLQVGLGGERALFAPWQNLTHLTIQEPEDISHYHEQIPYLSMISAAKVLAEASNAQVQLRTFLPASAAEAIWQLPAISPESSFSNVSLHDLRRGELIGNSLLTEIKKALDQNQKVIVLYNAHDRAAVINRHHRQEKVLRPGVETLAKRLAHRLGLEQLPPRIILGTRSIFTQPHTNVGLCIALNLDPLLDDLSFANLLHGLADLGQLARFNAPLCVQTHQPEHPLAQALATHRLSEYLQLIINEQREAQMPPFGQNIVCSHPGADALEAETVFQEMNPLVVSSWQLSHPFSAPWRKKPYTHLLLHANSTARLPLELRQYLVSLPRPWKVQVNPWYLL